ncbi:MAG TPA: ABC transporter permease [Bryobacteraceae bacterium]|nr:ABC transporter permease [Bryobacteraceae bacterium]
MNSFLLPAATLWQRELVRFWRQKSRVMGVVASPLVFWIFLGYGSNDLAKFYSGALVLTVMFSSIFSTITIIEDRREGFLLSMLVSPAPRTSLVFGKILGSATLAWIQGMLFLLFAPLAALHPSFADVVQLAIDIFVIAFTLTGFGFTMAWRMESTAGFHAIMNLVLFPMWIVSGAVFPLANAHGWIKGLMWVNPMTYCVSLLNGALRLADTTPGEWTSFAITGAFGVLLLLTSGMLAARRSKRSEA